MADCREDTESDALLFTAFKKLKVETDWDSSKLPKCDTGQKDQKHKNTKENVSKLKSPSKSYRERSQPYSKDKLPTVLCDLSGLDQLSLSNESCTKSSCPCNLKRRAGEAVERTGHSVPKNHLHVDVAHVCTESTGGTAGAAQCLVSPKRVLKEARLKLHHKHKDHKVVLRAARLRIAAAREGVNEKEGVRKEGFAASSKLCTESSPKIGQNVKEVNFGSQSNLEKNDFQSVVAAGSPKIVQKNQTSNNSKQKPVVFSSFRDQTYDFGALRRTLSSDSDDVGATEFSAAAQTKNHKYPLHPGKCTKLCSCSQQARLDDWSEEELACYFEEFVHIPKKMSLMAEMMYT